MKSRMAVGSGALLALIALGVVLAAAAALALAAGGSLSIRRRSGHRSFLWGGEEAEVRGRAKSQELSEPVSCFSMTFR